MGLLRFWLATSVALWHLGFAPGLIQPWLYPSLAVSAFYVISGFYMQLLVSERKSGEGWIAGFYASRLLRLFPLYLIFLAASLACVAWSPVFHFEAEAGQRVLASGSAGTIAYYILSNILIFGQEVARFGIFDPAGGGIYFVSNPLDFAPELRASSMPLMGQSWTVALELWFYLLVPILLVRHTAAIATIAALSLTLRVGIYFSGIVDVSWWNSFFPSELGVFLLGSLAARFYLHRLAMRPVSGKLVLYCIAVCMFLFLYGEYYMALHRWSAWLAYSVFVVVVSLVLPVLFCVTRFSSFDRFAGEMSYPIYLSHLVVGAVLLKIGVSTYYLSVIGVVICTMLGMVLVRYVERPLTKFRHRLSHRPNLPDPGNAKSIRAER